MKDNKNTSVILLIIKSKVFWAMIAAIVVLTVFILYLNIGNFFKYPRGYSNLFIYANIYNYNAIWFFAPLIPGFLLLKSIGINRILDVGKTLKGMMSLASMGSLLFLLAFIIEIIFFVIIDPTASAFPHNVIGMYSSALVLSPLLYVFCFMLHCMVWLFAFALFSIAILKNTQNDFLSLLFPVLLYRTFTYIPTRIGNISLTFLYYIFLL